MASQKVTAAEELSFEVTTTDFSPQIRRIANSGADSIILFGSNANLASALKAGGSARAEGAMVRAVLHR